MATLEYVQIPPYATRLHPNSHRAQSKVESSLPSPLRRASTFKSPTSPSNATSIGIGGQAMTLIPQLLFSSINIPADATGSEGANPPGTAAGSSSGNSRIISKARLLSSRDPLSIPISTANFRRFVSKVGPVFWLQDRVEEIILWRRGWRVTGSWMALYAFLCYFPRLILLIPHTVLISVLVSTHPSFSSQHPSNPDAEIPTPPPAQAAEASPAWQANLTAIQNLMGAISDLDDLLLPYLPYLTHKSPYTPLLAALTIVTLPMTLLLVCVPMFPLRLFALLAGWAVLGAGHPSVRSRVLPALLARAKSDKHVRCALAKAVDDDAMLDAVWSSELRSVELWENERWAEGAASSSGDNAAGEAKEGWGKGNLKVDERAAWTRGRDGWSGVGEGGVSNLTFSLAPGWRFVETEDWRPDLHADWAGEGVAGDLDGWVYTNDAWQDALPAPTNTKACSGAGWGGGAGVTRRRRWVRRIYYSNDEESPP
ncbi:hypothetical protein FIBSPDRAFT_952160 [Athelia psychrophila]|uniref:TECPR1-like DysF domain-containing protein n=1 Tax=Athelia psychrophila TaxID=1759441 RepID=A0A166LVP3_9AGAM|nr:hypothetical protein FIBSPDRAFT_952160 [Fibularhizoctonia sp. CBS 109695]